MDKVYDLITLQILIRVHRISDLLEEEAGQRHCSSFVY